MEVSVKVWVSSDEMGVYDLPIRFAEVRVDGKRFVLQSPAECETHTQRFLPWELVEGKAREPQLRALRQAAEAAWLLERMPARITAHTST